MENKPKNEICKVTALKGLGGSAEKGGLYEVTNMSGSAFPYLKTRGRRAEIRRLSSPQGVFSDGTLAYADNGRLYYGGDEIEGIYLTEGEKTILRLGEYLLVFPDGIYYNTGDGSDYGALSVSNTASGGRICCVDTHLAELDYTVVTSLPDEAEVGAYCALRQSDGSLSMRRYNGVFWYEVGCLIKLEAEGIGLGIRAGDTVSLSGVEALGSVMTVTVSEPDALYCEGTVASETLILGDITVERRVPIFDLVTVSGGRLCGVRRGRDLDGRIVCRMYVSRENDPFVFLPEGGGAWLDLDLGGAFTGLCDRLGSPVAFTEGEIIETRMKSGALLGTVIRSYGVAEGAHKSVASQNGDIYYLSPVGVCRYDGSYPEVISGELGSVEKSVGGSPAALAKGEYTIILTKGRYINTIYIYDIQNERWLKQGGLDARYLVKRRETVYALTADGVLVLMDYDGAAAPDYCLDEGYPVVEEKVGFFVETADIGLDTFGSVCPVRVTLRLKKPSDSAVSVAVRYDGGDMESEIALNGEINGAVTVPIPLKRCGSFRLIVSGEGECSFKGYMLEYRAEGAALWR